jgi:spermidine/putrescine transport system substrate-binding protein
MPQLEVRSFIDAWVHDRRRFCTMLAGLGLSAAVAPRRTLAQDPELMTYFTWAGFEPPEFHQAFIAKYGASPNVAFYGDTEEALAKLRSGFVADVVHPLVTDVPRWHDAEVIQAIDTARLSNWADVAPALAAAPGSVIDGQRYFVPNDWGITSLAYREDLVAPEDIEANSWSLLMDETYAGRLAMYDLVDIMVAFAAVMADVPDTTAASDEELARMREVWVRQRPLLRNYFTVETDAEAMLASGEIVACPLWPASVNRLVADGVPVKLMGSPKEGAFGWLDGLVIGARSEAHLDQAYDFIDAWLSPESGQYLIEAYGYGHSNLKSYELASPEAIRAVGLDPDKDIPLQIEAFRPLPTLPGPMLERYTAAIDDVLAGAD